MANDLWFGVIVEQNGKRLGTLAISPTALGWTRHGAKGSRTVSWGELDRILGKQAAAPAPAARKGASKPKAAAKAPKGTELRGTYRGKTIVATLRADGSIIIGGKKYDSPSAAATASVKAGRRDGWQFWKVQNARGKWVPLDSTRK